MASSEVPWRRNKNLREKEDYKFEVARQSIVIHQGKMYSDGKIDLGAVGRSVWDGAIVLAKFFEKHPHLVKDKVALELGSGTGLTGIAAVKLGAKHVILTDYYDMELLEWNVKDNIDDPEKASVQSLYWHDEITVEETGGPFELIIAADVIYQDVFVTPLIATLKCVADENSVIYLSYEPHWPNVVASFYEKAKDDFDIEVIPHSEQHEVYHHDLVFILKMKKKKKQ